MFPLASILAIAPVFVPAQSRDDLPHRFGSTYLYDLPSQKFDSKWTSRAWLGTAPQIGEARRDLETQFHQNGKGAEEKLSRLEGLAKTNPKDALAQFRWGYQSFLLANQDAENGRGRWQGVQGHLKRGEIRWALALAPDPRNPEYDRLRYLFESGSAPADLFRELGKRLILKWPNDEAILRNQALNLVNSSKPADVDQAVTITDQLLKKHPASLRYIDQKGFIHRAAWVSLHRKADGLATIEWTERYLARAELHPATRQALQRANDSIRNDLRKQ